MLVKFGYYEDQGLIQPEHTWWCMYSLNDMDRLANQRFLDDGYNIAAIKRYEEREVH